MGSGSSRKSSDAPRISVREPSKGGGSGGGKGGERSKNEFCPLIIKAKIDNDQKFPEGSGVTLKDSGTTVLMYCSGKKIGELSSRQSETVRYCTGLGFKYAGAIKFDGGLFYAELKRSN